MLIIRFFGGNTFGSAREMFSWWDDAYWADVLAFQSVLARFVRENGGGGLSFDTEVYWGLNSGRLSAWTDPQGRPREELERVILRRAAELSHAIFRECPDCRISFYGLGGPDLDLGLVFYDGFLTTHHFSQGVHWELYLYWFRRGYAWREAYERYLDRTLREFARRYPRHREYVERHCTLYVGLPAAYDRYYDDRIATKAQQKQPPAVPWALITAEEYARAVVEIAKFAGTVLIYPATPDYVYPEAAWEFRKHEEALTQIFDRAAYNRRAEAIAKAIRRLKGAGERSTAAGRQ